MKTLPQIFLESRERPDKHKALLFKVQGQWQSHTWKKYFEMAEGLAHYLIRAGVQAGDRVAIFSETRPEWAISDLGIQSLGGITVPIYANGNAEELAHVLLDSGSSFMIIDGAGQEKKWESVRSQCPQIREALVFDGGAWETAVRDGMKIAAENPGEIPRRIEKSQIDDPATIVYTSGTSGQPKGVVLTQRQVMSEITDIIKIFRIDHRDQTLSFSSLCSRSGAASKCGFPF